MKKITLLLFLLITTISLSQTIDVKDFKVNENLNQNFPSGTKFDFEFKIKGNYSYRTNGYHQIDLITYKNNVSSANEIARSYWNREDDVDLIFNNYTTKNWWNTALKSYSTKPGQVFKLVVKYANLTKTLTYIIPYPDSDGDNIPNNIDDCPDEAGPLSNNGCPYRPDFIPVARAIKKDENYGNITYEFCATIKNIGQGTGSPNRVQLILSTHNNLNAWGVVNANIASFGSGDIIPNETEEFCYSHSGDDFLGRGLAFYDYLHILIDEGTEESNDNNNDKAFSVYISSKKATKKNKTISPLSNLIAYDIKIFDISGRLINSAEVNSKTQENNIINNLPSGLYILKTPSGTRKIVK